MGFLQGLTQTIFGGSSSKQKSNSSSQSTSDSLSNSNSLSYNQAYPMLSEAYGGTLGQGTNATNAVSALLGLSDDGGASKAAFGNYLDSTDYNFTLDQGNKSLANIGATGGFLGSGKTLKAAQGFGQQTAQKYLGDYITRLLGLSQNGLAAGQLISGAGNLSQSESMSKSNSQSTSTGMSSGSSSSSPGVAGFIGKILSAGAGG